ncbi:vicilin Cor a 11.0101-like [Typha latifolia]|uniref:vicilin Cor a 11.0101-like n=1 Tax=Typha latifolia TaxID=4733 RepID=UPI003C2CE067
MAIKPKSLLPFLLFFALFFFLATTFAIAYQREGPEQRFQQCRQRCEESGQRGEQRQQCKLQCEKRYQQEKQQRQERERGTEDREDPQERLQECKQRCYQQHQGSQKQQQCTRRCEERYSGERERGTGSNPYQGEEEEEWTQENPYVFDRQSFRHRVRTEHGHIRVLKRFDEKSNLLSGIANYRLAIFEADPHAFVLPNHGDADCVCYVVKGRGTLSVLWGEQKQSFEINQGDIFATPAGAVIYLINSDNSERLVIVKLLQPVNIPGRFENFFGAGGQNPQSFYRAFSDQVLQAAFNTPSERLERIFGKQSKGAIIRASEEQIRALSRQEGGGRWPFGGRGSESRGTFNLLRKRPTFANRHGNLHEADANDYQWLRQLDVKVTFANISSGSMTAPFYNSRSTKIALVVEGNGEIEIICPHITRQSRHKGHGHRREEEQEEEQGEGQTGQQYQNVRAQVSPGVAFVVPAGHPTVEIASSSGGRSQNLQVICFEIRAENNERIFVAGKNNVLKNLPREAKELSFDSSAREVEEVFDAQEEEGFVAGPEEWQRRGRGVEGYNILEVAAGF